MAPEVAAMMDKFSAALQLALQLTPSTNDKKMLTLQASHPSITQLPTL